VLLNQDNESEEQLDLLKREWQAYLQWGFAASPSNQGIFDALKTSDLQVESDDFSSLPLAL